MCCLRVRCSSSSVCLSELLSMCITQCLELVIQISLGRDNPDQAISAILKRELSRLITPN